MTVISKGGTFVRITLLALLLALAAPRSLGAVIVNVEPVRYIPTGQDQTLYFDVFAVDGTTTDEQLTGFTFALDLASSPPGLRFVPTLGTLDLAHPYVFGDYAGREPVVFNATDTRIEVGAGLTAGQRPVDVRPERSGLARVGLFIPRDWFGSAQIPLDLNALSLSGAGPSITVAPGSSGGIPPPLPELPEPASSTLAAGCGAALLRRRRA
jgi:hypothetical protein